jgi:hypothetical protein
MKKFILLFITFISTFCLAQEVRLTFIDTETSAKIEGVMVYDKEFLIATSDKDGKASVEIPSSGKVQILMIDYQDIEFDINSNVSIVKLEKIKEYKLDEVVIVRLPINQILDSIKTHITKKISKYSYKNSVHFYTQLNSGKDTLLYFNNKLFFNKGVFSNNQNKIIKKFKLIKGPFSNYTALYNLNNVDFIFFEDFVFNILPYNSRELQIICKETNRYEYTIKSSEGKYLIEFVSKNNNESYPYVGHIIVDKFDYGVYEFKYALKSDKIAYRNIPFNKKLLKYNVLLDGGYFKYEKDENDKYNLITYSTTKKFIAKNEDLKGREFQYKSTLEPSIESNVNTSTLKKFNTMNYELE